MGHCRALVARKGRVPAGQTACNPSCEDGTPRHQLDHLRVAPRTEERVNLPNALDQFPPRRGRRGSQGRRG